MFDIHKNRQGKVRFILVWRLHILIFWEHSTCSSFFCLWAISPFQELMNTLYCLLFLEPQYSILFYSESILQQHVQLHLCLSLFKSKTSFFVYFYESTIVFSQWLRLHYFLHAIFEKNVSLIFKVRDFNTNHLIYWQLFCHCLLV